LAGSALFVGGCKLAISRALQPQWLDNLFKKDWFAKKLLLESGSFRNFSALSALLFWGIPAYAGWYHASRDPFEKKEQPLKFLAFLGSFFGPELVSRFVYDRKLKQLAIGPVNGKAVELKHQSVREALDFVKANPQLKEPLEAKLNQAMKLWGRNKVGGLLTSIALLGSSQLFNIKLTKGRLARAAAKSQALALPAGNLQRKSFSQWGQRSANGAQASLPF
jgi:hypothetical protein